jgi:hypothetical protein
MNYFLKAFSRQLLVIFDCLVDEKIISLLLLVLQPELGRETRGEMLQDLYLRFPLAGVSPA